MRTVKSLAVLTGDHKWPDPTKRNRRYNEEDLITHNAMAEAFESFSDFDVTVWNDHDRFLTSLGNNRPDLVVNFCDTGYHNVPTREINIPAYLEMLEIPYTGAPPSAMLLCFDKSIVRLVADSIGIPVPDEIFLPAGKPLEDIADRLSFPVLLKPNAADGSVGITKDAVCHDMKEAQAYLNALEKMLPERDVLLQEYLPGTEYGVGVIGNPATGFKILPPLEVDFSRLPDNLTPILSYESKAIPDSPYWTEITFKKAALKEETVARMAGWCQILFQRLNLRDYGRFDFRTDKNGQIKLMEVNPNPAWGNDGKLAFMAAFAGIDYPGMLRAIVEATVKRIAAED